jgi:hypothetical protein
MRRALPTGFVRRLRCVEAYPAEFLEEAAMRLLTALTIVTLTFIGSAPAQESRLPAPAQQPDKRTEWQSVITRQIEAFRASDGTAALNCAGQSFRDAFKNPTEFYEFIANSEYSPIVKSSSHTFGEFKIAEDEATVLQIVSITGRDQRVYKAIYEMTRETDGWKVQGVTKLIKDEDKESDSVVT